MTTDTQPEQEQDTLPEELIEQVRDALEHLYDLSYLQHHPLAHEEGPPTELAGQRLRRELAAAVESLSPGLGVPFRAAHARPYNLLTLHYVEGTTVQEAAHKLGISRRQAHRDLRRGIESVAALLRARRSIPAAEESNATQLSSVQAEMARLEHHPRPTDVNALLRRAHTTVEPLAARREVRLQVETPGEPVILSTDPVVAEQVLVNMLSQAVGQAGPETLHVTLKTAGEQATLTLRYFPESETAAAPAINLVVAQLVDRLGWTARQREEPEGLCTITLRMAARGPAVLVIDDNEGLVNLLERYLTDQACRVIAAADGQEGLGLAQEMTPDAIVLDVMMPEMHGWEVLQRLRNHPKTANIPVVICSVFNNPELAYSLGASFFLPKPVSRDDVLNALQQLGVV